MIQAQCTCGWTMAGPPADSWEIDEAVADHDIWCPDREDWVQAEMDGQEIERGRIINTIRAKFSPTCADFIVDVLTRNTKSDHGNPAKSSPAAAQEPNPQEEEQSASDATDHTASAWCPLWCTNTHENDWIDDSEEPTRHHTRLIGTMRTADMHPRASDIEVEIVQDETSGTTTSPYVSFYGDLDILTLADIDNITTLLARARQRLVEVGDD